ncbi:unnamed protein product [Amoebophrya sp. A120]|nr:unnamed protein product [Amoebophrya sp. A120]|eukprot:GSA120T00023422001.1
MVALASRRSFSLLLLTAAGRVNLFSLAVLKLKRSGKAKNVAHLTLPIGGFFRAGLVDPDQDREWTPRLTLPTHEPWLHFMDDESTSSAGENENTPSNSVLTKDVVRKPSSSYSDRSTTGVGADDREFYLAGFESSEKGKAGRRSSKRKRHQRAAKDTDFGTSTSTTVEPDEPGSTHLKKSRTLSPSPGENDESGTDYMMPLTSPFVFGESMSSHLLLTLPGHDQSTPSSTGSSMMRRSQREFNLAALAMDVSSDEGM